MTSIQDKINALAEYLEVNPAEIEYDNNSDYYDGQFIYNGERYNVATGEEADREYVLEVERLFEDLGFDEFAKVVATSEWDLMDYVDIERFANDSLDAYGHEHMLAPYDGYEYDLGHGLVAFRTY